MAASPDHNEKLLLAQVAGGDEKAFAELFHRWHKVLGSHVLGWTKSQQRAEEIVQDVFLKVWMKREGLTEINSFENYLFIISRNLSFNAIRDAARQRLKKIEWEKYAQMDPDSDPDDLSKELAPVLEQAILQLPEQQRKVYQLKRVEGLKYEDISQQLGISPDTARKHLQLAIRNITRYVKAHSYVMMLIFATPLVSN